MTDSAATPAAASRADYLVVARRYRPKTFSELIGQGQVSQALQNAITTGRVGHAYLFCGARGTGKTSTARIFAKCLNCVEGPTLTPCGECDSCVGIASGDDVDVLEIDGASNRGIDEIRELRANVHQMPIRSRFKIYIIDEVHMLTMQAFNALLKTLEEPPEHVKFIFCTTDPDDIPITVLSRCQRYDFAPVEEQAIVDRLREICAAEGVAAEEEALRLLARRAHGSLRDSQSLLEQLLSFAGEQITLAEVHQLLGTVRGGRLAKLLSHLAARQPGEALAEVDRAIAEGVEAGQLAEQLLGYLRDALVAAVGGQPDQMRHIGAEEFAAVKQLAHEQGVEALLAAAQIVDQTLVRMRQSTQGRTLLDVAIIRICHLEDLAGLTRLMEQVAAGATLAAAAGPPRAAAYNAEESDKKKSDPSLSPPAPAAIAAAPISEAASPGRGSLPPAAPPAANRVDAAHAAPTVESAESPNYDQLWRQAIEQVGGLTLQAALHYESLAIVAPNRLVATFPAGYNSAKLLDAAETKSRLERQLAELAGRPLKVEIVCPERRAAAAVKTPPARSALDERRDKLRHPLVSAAIEMFDGELID